MGLLAEARTQRGCSAINSCAVHILVVADNSPGGTRTRDGSRPINHRTTFRNDLRCFNCAVNSSGTANRGRTRCWIAKRLRMPARHAPTKAIGGRHQNQL
jgi:hypothetical protein